MESVRIFSESQLQSNNPEACRQKVCEDLQQTFENFVKFLFPDVQVKF